jgi:SPP1 gp7 family putative phage head morphogenesis protein
MPENLADFGFVTDANALATILAKKSRGTPLNSKAISELWDDAAKSKAFFSARVTSADILEGLREQVNHVITGQVSKEQAVWWMKRFLESKGDSALTDMGFATVEAAKAGDSLAELGSHRRLSLIVDQNVSMARSAREWQQMKEDADIVPFVRYHTREDGSVRNSHAILNKLVFRKDDPALRQIFPPQDFRCRCRLEELDEDDAAGLPIQNGLPDGWAPAASGYTFDPEQWAAQGLEAKEKWGDDLTKNFEADSMAHGQGRIDALQKNRDIMADLANTSTDKWQKADAEKAVSSFDERIAQVKADMQAKEAGADKKKTDEVNAKAKLDEAAEYEAKKSRLDSLAYESERFKQLKDEKVKELLSSGVAEEIATQKAIIWAENESKREIKNAEIQRKSEETKAINRKIKDDENKEKERINKEKVNVVVDRAELFNRSHKAYIASQFLGESIDITTEKAKAIVDIALGLMVVNPKIEIDAAVKISLTTLQNDEDAIIKAQKAKNKRKKKA